MLYTTVTKDLHSQIKCPKNRSFELGSTLCFTSPIETGLGLLVKDYEVTGEEEGVITLNRVCKKCFDKWTCNADREVHTYPLRDPPCDCAPWAIGKLQEFYRPSGKCVSSTDPETSTPQPNSTTSFNPSWPYVSSSSHDVESPDAPRLHLCRRLPLHVRPS